MGVGLVCSPGAICTKLTPISREMEMRVGVILVWTKPHSSAKTWFFSPKYPLSLVKMHCKRNITQTSTQHQNLLLILIVFYILNNWRYSILHESIVVSLEPGNSLQR